MPSNTLDLFLVPSDIAPLIDLVTGITELPPGNALQSSSELGNPNRFNRRQSDDNQCNVPYTIKKLYGVPENLMVTNPNANQSIYAQEQQGADGFGVGSVADFEKANALPPVATNFLLY